MKIQKTTVKDAIDVIYRLDCEAYTEEITTKQWYLNRYDGRECVYLAVDEKQGVVAYFAVMDIKEPMKTAIENGVLDGDVVVSNNMFQGDGRYFYMASCVVDKSFRRRGVFKMLFNAVMEDYRGKFLCALANEKTTLPLLEAGFRIVCNNGHYNSLVRD